MTTNKTRQDDPELPDKVKTSIIVDRKIWVRFNDELYRRLRTKSFSRGLELLISDWLPERTHHHKATDQAKTQHRRAPEIEALLSYFSDPPTELDEAMCRSVRLRLRELARLPGTKKPESA